MKENEKRKHASLTIVGTRRNLALRLARQNEGHCKGALLAGAEGYCAMAPDMPGERTDGILIERSSGISAHGVKKPILMDKDRLREDCGCGEGAC